MRRKAQRQQQLAAGDDEGALGELDVEGLDQLPDAMQPQELDQAHQVQRLDLLREGPGLEDAVDVLHGDDAEHVEKEHARDVVHPYLGKVLDQAEVGAADGRDHPLGRVEADHNVGEEKQVCEEVEPRNDVVEHLPGGQVCLLPREHVARRHRVHRQEPELVGDGPRDVHAGYGSYHVPELKESITPHVVLLPRGGRPPRDLGVEPGPPVAREVVVDLPLRLRLPLRALERLDLVPLHVGDVMRLTVGDDVRHRIVAAYHPMLADHLVQRGRGRAPAALDLHGCPPTAPPSFRLGPPGNLGVNRFTSAPLRAAQSLSQCHIGVARFPSR
mmetsp:Transcript_43235/g.108262  ORF Transcript_43235/g.108262 Transcript_43235/m.108262 type:complete len:329 (+) Transcript_43235:2673-3659(+)